MSNEKRIRPYPFQIRFNYGLRVDDKLRGAIHERAYARDRRVGWEMIRLIKAGLAAKHIPEDIAWAPSKLGTTMRLEVDFMDERTKRRIRARAIRNNRTLAGEIIHLLKAAIMAEALSAKPPESAEAQPKPQIVEATVRPWRRAGTNRAARVGGAA